LHDYDSRDHFQREETSDLATGEKMINAKIIVWIRKSTFLLWLITLIFAFGCGPAATEIVIVFPTATGSPTPTPSPTAQPTETQIPTPTLTPFVPKAIIKIFTQSPLSGNRADYGQDILHGAELAVQQLSSPLSEDGYKVQLVPYDDQNVVETALANAKGIVADPEILCGVGHYDSDITIATSDIYHEAGLAFVSSAATDPLLTDRNYLEVNRLVGRADGQGFAAAQFAQAQGFKTVFIISQKRENSVKNAEAFRVESGNLGIKRLGSVIDAVTDENRDQVVHQIVTLSPELIYISTAASQALPLLTALRASGYAGTFLGTERLNSPSAISNEGASLVQGGGLYYTITSAPANYHPNAAKFVQDFETQYENAPLSFAAQAYDATGICLKAIEQASKARGGELPARAEVARAIRALKDYEGITGTYSFNGHGDPTPVPYYVYQVVSTDTASWDQNPIVAAYEVNPP
jgi:branched-chain amino acid transport system substrate-binding protein